MPCGVCRSLRSPVKLLTTSFVRGLPESILETVRACRADREDKLPSSQTQSPVQMHPCLCNLDKLHIAPKCDKHKNSTVLKCNPIRWDKRCTHPTFADSTLLASLKNPKILLRLRSSRPTIGISAVNEFSSSLELVWPE